MESRCSSTCLSVSFSEADGLFYLLSPLLLLYAFTLSQFNLVTIGKKIQGHFEGEQLGTTDIMSFLILRLCKQRPREVGCRVQGQRCKAQGVVCKYSGREQETAVQRTTVSVDHATVDSSPGTQPGPFGLLSWDPRPGFGTLW